MMAAPTPTRGRADWRTSGAVSFWRTLPSDPSARFDREVTLDAADIAPMVTWGTSPEDATAITGRVPDPASLGRRPRTSAPPCARRIDYMGLAPGTPISGIPVDRVFIGSCTNSRIEDLRLAARGIAAGPPASPTPSTHMVVSRLGGLVKRQAEAEGLDRIFTAAGFEWREAGCSMCVGMNGDLVAPGERCASTSNRNFVGRQGKGARTHLVSPIDGRRAAAVTGAFTDVRRLLRD